MNSWIVSPQSAEILVGTNDLTTGGTYYGIEAFVSHPEYNKPRFAYDVGLILVSGNIAFSDRTQAIELSADAVPHDTTLKLSKVASSFTELSRNLLFCSLVFYSWLGQNFGKFKNSSMILNDWYLNGILSSISQVDQFRSSYK